MRRSRDAPSIHALAIAIAAINWEGHRGSSSLAEWIASTSRGQSTDWTTAARSNPAFTFGSGDGSPAGQESVLGSKLAVKKARNNRNTGSQRDLGSWRRRRAQIIRARMARLSQRLARNYSMQTTNSNRSTSLRTVGPRGSDFSSLPTRRLDRVDGALRP